MRGGTHGCLFGPGVICRALVRNGVALVGPHTPGQSNQKQAYNAPAKANAGSSCTASVRGFACPALRGAVCSASGNGAPVGFSGYWEFRCTGPHWGGTSALSVPQSPLMCPCPRCCPKPQRHCPRLGLPLGSILGLWGWGIVGVSGSGPKAPEETFCPFSLRESDWGNW